MNSTKDDKEFVCVRVIRLIRLRLFGVKIDKARSRMLV